MLPLAAHPAVHCSSTRTMSRVGLPGISDPTPSAEIRADAGLEQQLVGDRRRPGRLLHALACGISSVVPPVSGADVALQEGLDDPGAPQMISPGPDWRQPSIVAEPGRALAGMLLVPEQVELVARRRLEGERGPRRSASCRPGPPVASCRPRRSTSSDRPCSGWRTCRARAMAAFVAELNEKPQPVLHDWTADGDVVVPQLGQLARASLRPRGLQRRRCSCCRPSRW